MYLMKPPAIVPKHKKSRRDDEGYNSATISLTGNNNNFGITDNVLPPVLTKFSKKSNRKSPMQNRQIKIDKLFPIKRIRFRTSDSTNTKCKIKNENTDQINCPRSTISKNFNFANKTELYKPLTDHVFYGSQKLIVHHSDKTMLTMIKHMAFYRSNLLPKKLKNIFIHEGYKIVEYNFNSKIRFLDLQSYVQLTTVSQQKRNSSSSSPESSMNDDSKSYSTTNNCTSYLNQSRLFPFNETISNDFTLGAQYFNQPLDKHEVRKVVKRIVCGLYDLYKEGILLRDYQFVIDRKNLLFGVCTKRGYQV